MGDEFKKEKLKEEGDKGLRWDRKTRSENAGERQKKDMMIERTGRMRSRGDNGKRKGEKREEWEEWGEDKYCRCERRRTCEGIEERKTGRSEWGEGKL